MAYIWGSIYDDGALTARRRLLAAESEREAAAGTERAWLVHKRTNHYWRRLRMRAEGIHQSAYVVSENGTHCACGLIVPTSYTNFLSAPGHLTFESLEAEDVTALEVEYLVIGRTTAENPSGDDLGFGCHCHRCQWASFASTLADARRDAAVHREACRRTQVTGVLTRRNGSPATARKRSAFLCGATKLRLGGRAVLIAIVG
jgi:hypothetical protein